MQLYNSCSKLEIWKSNTLNLREYYPIWFSVIQNQKTLGAGLEHGRTKNRLAFVNKWQKNPLIIVRRTKVKKICHGQKRGNEPSILVDHNKNKHNSIHCLLTLEICLVLHICISRNKDLCSLLFSPRLHFAVISLLCYRKYYRKVSIRWITFLQGYIQGDPK